MQIAPGVYRGRRPPRRKLASSDRDHPVPERSREHHLQGSDPPRQGNETSSPAVSAFGVCISDLVKAAEAAASPAEAIELYRRSTTAYRALVNVASQRSIRRVQTQTAPRWFSSRRGDRTTLRAESAGLAWMFGIAHNVVRNTVRTRRRHRSLLRRFHSPCSLASLRSTPPGSTRRPRLPVCLPRWIGYPRTKATSSP